MSKKGNNRHKKRPLLVRVKVTHASEDEEAKARRAITRALSEEFTRIDVEFDEPE
jgi:hypothetical protein